MSIPPNVFTVPLAGYDLGICLGYASVWYSRGGKDWHWSKWQPAVAYLLQHRGLLRDPQLANVQSEQSCVAKREELGNEISGISKIHGAVYSLGLHIGLAEYSVAILGIDNESAANWLQVRERARVAVGQAQQDLRNLNVQYFTSYINIMEQIIGALGRCPSWDQIGKYPPNLDDKYAQSMRNAIEVWSPA